MTEKKTIKKEKTVKSEEKGAEAKPAVFSGKYISTVGRRKTAVARVFLYKDGQGEMVANGKPFDKYFNETKLAVAKDSLKLTNHLTDVNISAVISGGGSNAQAEAVRHAISRALIILDIELRPAIKAKGWLTRDSREVERKKPGLKKARRAPQWSKR